MPRPDPADEVTDRLAALEAVPAGFGRPSPQLRIGLGGLLRRAAVPHGVTDLLEPRVDHLGRSERLEQWCRCLARTHQRRHQHLVEALVAQPCCEPFGLPVSSFGERWIDHRQPVSHPLGLAVTDQHDLHGRRL
jgi:hypothetical protein